MTDWNTLMFIASDKCPECFAEGKHQLFSLMFNAQLAKLLHSQENAKLTEES